MTSMGEITHCGDEAPSKQHTKKLDGNDLAAPLSHRKPPMHFKAFVHPHQHNNQARVPKQLFSKFLFVQVIVCLG